MRVCIVCSRPAKGDEFCSTEHARQHFNVVWATDPKPAKERLPRRRSRVKLREALEDLRRGA
jgi:hypothetical protein